MRRDRGALLASLLSVATLARCQCDESLTGIPAPEIDVCDDSGACHNPETLELRLDLGAAAIGQEVRTAFVVHNRGNQPLLVSRVALDPNVEASADFRLLLGGFGGEVAPEGSHRFEVVYTPTDGGGDSATYEVLSNDEDEPRVLVVLSARGDGPRICPRPPLVISFGAVPVGQRVLERKTFESCGTRPLTVERIELADDGDGVFSLDRLPRLPLQLEVGATFDVEVAFEPTEARFYQGDLLIASDDNAAVEGHVALEGSGAACDLEAYPRQVLFGAVYQTVEERRDVVLENRGTLDCTVSDIARTSGSSEFTLAGGFGGAFSLAPAAVHTLTFAYTPVDVGTDNAVFTVTSDDPGEPAIALSLEGRDAGRPECLLEIDPAIYDFGGVARGTRASGQVTLRNVGPRACLILAFSLAAGSSPAFTFDPPGLGALGLQSGQSMSVAVHFEPFAAGPQTGRLEVKVGVTQQLATSGELRGNGLGGQICTRPEIVDFGVVDLGQAARRSAWVGNCGSEALNLIGLAITPTGEIGFDGAAPAAQPIAPGAEIEVRLAYTPADVGRDQATLRVTSDDALTPLRDVPLVGHGVTAGTACGNVKGRICAPDGTTWLGGALVWIESAGQRAEATTTPEGHFLLTCAPVGQQTAHVESGSWTTTFPVEVVDGQTTVLDQPECLDPGSASIAVILGCWDSMESILDRVGADHDLYEFRTAGELCEEGSWSAPDADDLLRDPVELATYDILFINCGADDSGASDSTIIANLRAFIAAGGSLLTSDWGYDWVEQAWPDAVDFLGDDASPDAAQTGVFGCPCLVNDPDLMNALGTQSFQMRDAYTDTESVDATTRALLTCKDGPHAGHVQMLMFDRGQGRVGYTTFHNAAQTDAIADALFNWLIFHL